MKLTKDDFENIGFREDMTEQILKNQEDAEKWNDNTIEYCVELKRIVERLKKRIEENIWQECDCEYGGCRHSFASELQKILGEGK